MSVNLKNMSDKELDKLGDDLEKERKSREKSKKDDARKAAEAAAKKHGFSLTDLVNGARGNRKKGSAPAKYRNPKNPSETWSGRGRQPQWYKDAVAKGTDPKSLEI